LRDIELRAADPSQRDQLLEELAHMDARAEKIVVPLSYADELYSLRANIQLIRSKIVR
jgi:hypothetical protein